MTAAELAWFHNFFRHLLTNPVRYILMGIFNEHSTSHTYTRGFLGLRRPPGIGYKLTQDGNYDMEKNQDKMIVMF